MNSKFQIIVAEFQLKNQRLTNLIMKAENEYPKIMQVSLNSCFAHSCQRVVILKKNGKYLAWKEATDFEEAKGITDLNWWNYAREIDPYRELKKAYKQGKIIQQKYASNPDKWQDVEGSIDAICNNNIIENLRIKPTPIYIPFDFSDAEKLIGKAIKYHNEVLLITKVNEKGIWVNGEFYFDYENIMECTFLDGTICGKLKQD